MEANHKNEPASKELGNINGDGKQLTRQQRRKQELAQKEALERFAKFCDTFSNWLYDTPKITEESVKEKIADLNARWMIYCRQVRMNPGGMTAFKEFAEKLYLEYKKELTNESN